MTTTTRTKPFEVQLDICFDDYSNEWEAVGMLIHHAKIESQVVSIEHAGVTACCWPSLKIFVKTEDAARSLLAEYLQLDRYDEEVEEYMQYLE